MGSNNSRLNGTSGGGAEVFPARIRPLLRRRIEELRNRKNVDTLSKQQLLKDESSSHENETEDKVETVVQVVAVEKLSKVVPLPVSEEQSNELDDNDHDDENDDDDDDADDNETGRLIGDGSPSFRIYCIEANKRKEEQIYTMHHRSHSADSIESASSASRKSLHSNEVVKIESIPKRRTNSIKKLGAMKKNLLNVKNLHKNRMNPMCSCTGQHWQKEH
ncbi:uncharacterized protein LOC133304850 [Gastrolobium bilobum]|uniref:uncharacterized protein LOC133304850 n=1 Tax=Gastrolobium bilobum TaxID=150636 RepID=UPI002AB2C6BE|nr:uncharacterized protein LOC133304850 [Gastrolobium bilobum]